MSLGIVVLQQLFTQMETGTRTAQSESDMPADIKACFFGHVTFLIGRNVIRPYAENFPRAIVYKCKI